MMIEFTDKDGTKVELRISSPHKDKFSLEQRVLQLLKKLPKKELKTAPSQTNGDY
jgi:hypothetical protein